VELTVGEIVIQEPLDSVTPEDDLDNALKLISKHNINQVLVLRDGKCAGLLSRANIIYPYTDKLRA
jgi:CBS domain-containing protein